MVRNVVMGPYRVSGYGSDQCELTKTPWNENDWCVGSWKAHYRHHK